MVVQRKTEEATLVEFEISEVKPIEAVPEEVAVTLAAAKPEEVAPTEVEIKIAPKKPEEKEVVVEEVEVPEKPEEKVPEKKKPLTEEEKKEEEIFKLLKDVQPEKYEKVLRKKGIIQPKLIKKHIEMVVQRKAEEATIVEFEISKEKPEEAVPEEVAITLAAAKPEEVAPTEVEMRVAPKKPEEKEVVVEEVEVVPEKPEEKVPEKKKPVTEEEKKEEEIFELLKDVQPEKYEKVLRKKGIIQPKLIKKHIEMVVQRKAEEATLVEFEISEEKPIEAVSEEVAVTLAAAKPEEVAPTEVEIKVAPKKPKEKDSVVEEVDIIPEKPEEKEVVEIKIPKKKKPRTEEERKDEEIFELLKDVQPKDYEKVLRKKGIIQMSVIRKHIEKVEKRKAEEITLKVIHCTLIYICAILLNQFVNCLII